jgi:dephospho-CoA kinase
MVLGISGYTGSGKSIVARYLCEKYDFALIDADKIARKLMLENEKLISEVSKEFGSVENGAIDFVKLGEIVFESAKNLQKLNSITFPYIIPEIKTALKSSQFAVIDAALLPLFLPQIGECRFAIWIESDIDKRVERLQKRIGLSVPQIRNRIQKQTELMPAPDECDLWKIVENNSSAEGLFKKIDEIFSKFP